MEESVVDEGKISLHWLEEAGSDSKNKAHLRKKLPLLERKIDGSENGPDRRSFGSREFKWKSQKGIPSRLNAVQGKAFQMDYARPPERMMGSKGLALQRIDGRGIRSKEDSSSFVEGLNGLRSDGDNRIRPVFVGAFTGRCLKQEAAGMRRLWKMVGANRLGPMNTDHFRPPNES